MKLSALNPFARLGRLNKAVLRGFIVLSVIAVGVGWWNAAEAHANYRDQIDKAESAERKNALPYSNYLPR